MSEKKGEQVSQLKFSIKRNQENMEHAKASLREGSRVIDILAILVDDVLRTLRMSEK